MCESRFPAATLNENESPEQEASLCHYQAEGTLALPTDTFELTSPAASKRRATFIFNQIKIVFLLQLGQVGSHLTPFNAEVGPNVKQLWRVIIIRPWKASRILSKATTTIFGVGLFFSAISCQIWPPVPSRVMKVANVSRTVAFERTCNSNRSPHSTSRRPASGPGKRGLRKHPKWPPVSYSPLPHFPFVPFVPNSQREGMSGVF